MDRDLLMMIYGALIGLGSSLITALFQSWLSQKEHKRQQEVEKKAQQQQIRTPTMEELVAIRNGTYAPAQKTRIDSVTKSPDLLKEDKKILVIALIVFLFYCGGIGYLLIWRSNPALNLVIAGFVSFVTFYVLKWTIKTR